MVGLTAHTLSPPVVLRGGLILNPALQGASQGGRTVKVTGAIADGHGEPEEVGPAPVNAHYSHIPTPFIAWFILCVIL